MTVIVLFCTSQLDGFVFTDIVHVYCVPLRDGITVGRTNVLSTTTVLPLELLHVILRYVNVLFTHCISALLPSLTFVKLSSFLSMILLFETKTIKLHYSKESCKLYILPFKHRSVVLVVALCPTMLPLQVYIPASLVCTCDIVSVVMNNDETVDVDEIEMFLSVVELLL